jgi:hypothetical protein
MFGLHSICVCFPSTRKLVTYAKRTVWSLVQSCGGGSVCFQVPYSTLSVFLLVRTGFVFKYSPVPNPALLLYFIVSLFAKIHFILMKCLNNPHKCINDIARAVVWGSLST